MHKNDELARLVVDLFKKNKNEDLRKKVFQLTEGQVKNFIKICRSYFSYPIGLPNFVYFQLERLFENCSANNFSDVHDLVKAIFSCKVT